MRPAEHLSPIIGVPRPLSLSAPPVTVQRWLSTDVPHDCLLGPPESTNHRLGEPFAIGHLPRWPPRRADLASLTAEAPAAGSAARPAGAGCRPARACLWPAFISVTRYTERATGGVTARWAQVASTAAAAAMQTAPALCRNKRREMGRDERLDGW